MKLHNFFAILLLQVIAVTLEYDLRCPVAGEWRYRPRKYKCGATQYVCLLFLPYNIYRETCDGLDYSSRGSKLVFEPNFNKAKCNYKRYQPFPFLTDGSSDCVYQKSLCNEEGQSVYHKGTFRNNTSCGCDFLHGYTFVTKPKNNCFCKPSEEDCSCHKNICHDKETNCSQDVAVLLNTSCSDSDVSLLPENDQSVGGRKIRLKISIDYCNIYKRSRPHGVYITVVVLIMLICIAILVILYILITNQLTIKVKSQRVALDDKHNASLECNIGVPCSCLVRSIEWLKDDKTVSGTSTSQDWNKKIAGLYFKDVEDKDVGIYTCVVHTIFTEHTSGQMRLFYEGPLFTDTKKNNLGHEGDPVKLSCTIQSESDIISVEWYKGNLLLDLKDDEKYEYHQKCNLHVLTIKNLTKEDISAYKCTASNAKGTREIGDIYLTLK